MSEILKEEAPFAAAFIAMRGKKGVKDTMVLGVQDEKYQEVKMPGGVGETTSSGGNESHYLTMKREVNSEAGVQVISARLVLVEKRTNRRTGGLHRRYFYLAEEVSALPALDAPPRQVTETNPGNGSTEVLSCYWLPLREFAKRLFRGQHLAFGAVLAQLASDRETGLEFCIEFADLLEEFPEPSELGLED
jgi:ADP-ribose pyrophosphatase YjhB (NUDIX family)